MIVPELLGEDEKRVVRGERAVPGGDAAPTLLLGPPLGRPADRRDGGAERARRRRRHLHRLVRARRAVRPSAARSSSRRRIARSESASASSLATACSASGGPRSRSGTAPGRPSSSRCRCWSSPASGRRADRRLAVRRPSGSARCSATASRSVPREPVRGARSPPRPARWGRRCRSGCSGRPVPPAAYAAALVVSGIANGLVNPSLHTISTLRIPAALRPNVMTTMMVFWALINPLGVFLAGPILGRVRDDARADRIRGRADPDDGDLLAGSRARARAKARRASARDLPVTLPLACPACGGALAA